MRRDLPGQRAQQEVLRFERAVLPIGRLMGMFATHGELDEVTREIAWDVWVGWGFGQR